MKRLARFSPSLIVWLLLAAPAVAQTEYRFELFAGGSFPVDKDFIIGQPQASPPMKGSYQFSNAFRGGVRFGADFKKYWGEDILYSYGSNSSRILNTTDPSNPATFPFSFNSHQVAFNMLWYPTGTDAAKKVFPYVTAGVGTTFFSISGEEINAALEAGLPKLQSEHIFAFNAGGGVRLKLNPHIGLRLDARDYMTRSPRFGLPESSDDPAVWVFPTSGVFHQMEVSFAFIYYF